MNDRRVILPEPFFYKLFLSVDIDRVSYFPITDTIVLKLDRFFVSGLVIEHLGIDGFVLGGESEDGGEEGDRYSIVVEFSNESQGLGADIQFSCCHQKIFTVTFEKFDLFESFVLRCEDSDTKW